MPTDDTGPEARASDVPVKVPTTLADVARAQVRQLSAAVYGLVAALIAGSFALEDGWVTLVVTGSVAVFTGWLVARITDGPWWSWALTGPWLAFLDLALHVGVVRAFTSGELDVAALALAAAPGSAVLLLLSSIGALVAVIARRRGARSKGIRPVS